MPISKDLFIQILEMMQKQVEIDNEVGRALELVCDNAIVYGTENLYYKALLKLLKHCCNDFYNYIEWWLYDNVEKKIYSIDQNTVLYDVESVEDFYNFIVESQDNWKAVINKHRTEEV